MVFRNRKEQKQKLTKIWAKYCTVFGHAQTEKFMAAFASPGLWLFFKIPAVSLYWPLPSCKILQRSDNGKLQNFAGQTDGRTDKANHIEPAFSWEGPK